LDKLKKKFPALARLSEHREALRRIFEDGRFRQPESAIKWLRAWCRRGEQMGLKALTKFNATMENWMDRIANYFVRRSSNGRAEGFNRRLRAILWRACGMTNFDHFRLRVLHAFG
jgi:transposase